MGVYNFGLGLETFRLRENLDRHGSVDRKSAQNLHITTVRAEFGDLSGHVCSGLHLREFRDGYEWNSGSASFFLKHRLSSSASLKLSAYRCRLTERLNRFRLIVHNVEDR